ncbi:hypothetical protein, partial [Petrachloros mirabilis]
MNRVKNIDVGQLALVLIGLLVLPGCTMTSHSPATSTIVASLSYEIPAGVDVKAVVDILEESSMKTLRKPATVDETASPHIPADTRSPVILQEHVTSLEGLGEVVIPSILCPGALTSMHTLMPSKRGLRLVASCVVIGNSEIRIYLVDATTAETRGSAHSDPFQESADSSPINLIGGVLTERLPGIHPLQPPDIPLHRMSYSTLEKAAAAEEGPGHAIGETADGDHSIGAHATPLVCFSPKAEGIAVSDNPGSNLVVGRLDKELIVQ